MSFSKRLLIMGIIKIPLLFLRGISKEDPKQGKLEKGGKSGKEAISRAERKHHETLATVCSIRITPICQALPKLQDFEHYM